MENLKMKSPNIAEQHVEKIKELFPNCVVEVKDEETGELKHVIDFDLLRQELAGEIVEGPQERYQFTWPDKRKAVLAANTPTSNTLRPLLEKSVSFEDTKNLYIEGDNLEVLKVLRETYMGTAKMIYIDPPYNTGSDLVYMDDFKSGKDAFLSVQGDIDDQGQRLYVNSDTFGRFHTNWLNMMYPRLVLAKDILRDDGVLFVSIDDNEQENLVKLGKEIFGEQNYVGCFPRVTKKSGKAHSSTIARNHDYIFIFAKNIGLSKFAGLSENTAGFDNEDEFVETRGKYKLNQTLDYNSLWYNPAMDFEVEIDGEKFYPGGSKEEMEARHGGNHNPKDWVWRWSKKKLEFGIEHGFVVIKRTSNGARIYTKTYLGATISKDGSGNYYVEEFKRDNVVSSLAFTENEFSNDNAKKELAKIMDANSFDFPKPVSLLKSLITIVDDKDGLFIDFFSGSGTLGQAVYEKNIEDGGNRRFLLVQIPEELDSASKAYSSGMKTICDLAERRIAEAGQSLERDNPLALFNNKGFRVLKLDSSNMKNVFYSPEDYSPDLLENSETAIKPDRSSLDLMVQVMLELGITLDAEIKSKNLDGCQVYIVNDNDLICCFDGKVNEKDISEIAKLQPLTVAFRDDSFFDDTISVNCEGIFKQLSPSTKIKIV